MSFRFSNERYAQKFWKAKWRPMPAFFLQGGASYGWVPHSSCPFFDCMDMEWSDRSNFWPLDCSCRRVILNPNPNWQALTSISPSLLMILWASHSLLEIPRVVTVSCPDPGCYTGVRRCPNFWEWKWQVESFPYSQLILNFWVPSVTRQYLTSYSLWFCDVVAKRTDYSSASS